MQENWNFNVLQKFDSPMSTFPGLWENPALTRTNLSKQWQNLKDGTDSLYAIRFKKDSTLNQLIGFGNIFAEEEEHYTKISNNSIDNTFSIPS